MSDRWHPDDPAYDDEVPACPECGGPVSQYGETCLGCCCAHVSPDPTEIERDEPSPYAGASHEELLEWLTILSAQVHEVTGTTEREFAQSSLPRALLLAKHLREYTEPEETE